MQEYAMIIENIQKCIEYKKEYFTGDKL